MILFIVCAALNSWWLNMCISILLHTLCYSKELERQRQRSCSSSPPGALLLFSSTTPHRQATSLRSGSGGLFWKFLLKILAI
ncbi:hypothetical protein DFH05DRAFT_918533 [Lentinula detonsa]|uniref:Secreted protein n=1 Tax=Lentinula detonsa TaxID=2804962 RepID=A0A9W8TZF0_9AGAR|nr:hypothetical protein DFH05DRAFT_918533 [Lentinula detonsa]